MLTHRDTAAKGLGFPASSTRHISGQEWVSAATGYDARGRSLGSTLTLPAEGIPGFAPSYTVSQTYDRADRPTSVTYPAVGSSLAQETVATAYNGYGLPATMKATSGYSTEYVWAAAYDDRLRPFGTAIGPRNPSHSYEWGLVGVYEYNTDQQLDRSYMYNSWSSLPGGIIADNKVTFRDDGHVTARDSSLGGETWRECYGYDPRARLTSTYTVASGAECSDANKGGGDQPFERGYTYSSDGKLEAREEDGVATAYTYPTGGAGSVRPHAPSKVGTQDYTWNSDGSLDTRTVAGGIEKFNWDTEHLLSSIGSPSGSTSFVYGVDGSRLLRTAPDGSRTLYFAGHEVTADAAGTSVTAVRSYSFGGRLVATRSSTGVDYMVSDAAGSVQGSIAPGAADLSGTRRYDPYGQARAETGASPETDRGFLGQIEDAGTGLSYLNARYYDTESALFVSADPLFDTAKPNSLNPYTYGFNNPVGFSDPSGMMSSTVWGLARENSLLRGQVKQLQGIITRMAGQITELQGIIKEQQRALNEAYTYIAALQAQIRAMNDYIGKLQARVRDLEAQVTYWYGEAQKWKGEARKWRDRAAYLYIVAVDFVNHYYREPYRETVISMIDQGTWLGIGRYDAVHTYISPVSGRFYVWGTNIEWQHMIDMGRAEGRIDVLEDEVAGIQRALDLADAALRNDQLARGSGEGPSDEVADAEVMAAACSGVSTADSAANYVTGFTVLKVPDAIDQAIAVGEILCGAFG